MGRHHKSTLVFFVWTALFNLVVGFYLPGLAPVNYCQEQEQQHNCKVGSFEFLLGQKTETWDLHHSFDD